MSNARKVAAPIQGARLRVVWENSSVPSAPAMPACLQLAPRFPKAPAAQITAPRINPRKLFLVQPGAAPKPAPTDTLAQARRIVAQVEWEIQQRAARDRARHLQLCSATATAPAPAAGFTARLRAALGF